MDKLPPAHDKVFIQLDNFPTHYLVILISDDGFHYVLMSMKPVTPDSPNLIINDLASLDVKRIQQQHFHNHSIITGQKRKRADDGISDGIDIYEIYRA
jgi:mediator of RNA polymerase II transcription subunit 14